MVDPNIPVWNDNPGSIVDECESEYTLHDGTLVMPVMGDSTQTPVVVRLHPPYTTRKVEFNYARSKTPPSIPPPGDTQPNGVVEGGTQGDTYLGGSIIIPAPRAAADGDLIYEVRGGYNFLVANDVRMNGKIRFDAHGYRSMIDFLGYIKDPDGETWVDPYYDLNQLASSRILG